MISWPAGRTQDETVLHVTERAGHSARDAWADQEASIDDLIDRAVSAMNRGDRVTATALAGRVLAADERNADAEDLLAIPGGKAGEIRRLTMFFADLVDSTVLSRRVEPETYRLLVGSYRDIVLRLVQRYEGHIGSIKGDGVLALFGHPITHEDDVRRAVLVGLEISREVDRLAEQARRRFGIEIAVRVGVHRGLVYLDTNEDDVYGLGANLAARVSGLAPPGAVVVSDAVEPLVRDSFELRALPPAPVKGIDGMITHYLVAGERMTPATTVGQAPIVGRERELMRLQKSWARAKAGNLKTPGVVLRGEPGIGKSRLAAEAIELVRRDGGAVLELTGSPFHTDVGLHPVRALLERRCGIDRLTEPRERLTLLEHEIAAQSLDPATTVPLLAPVLGIAPKHGYEPVPADGDNLQELIAEATRSYLLGCFGGAPGLLVAEDVHWFDPSTIELVGCLLGAGDGRTLMVVTGRPGDWLPPAWPVRVFELAPLTDEQTDTLVRALHPTVSAEAMAAVRERCDGVPFYIEQVVAELHASDDAAAVPDALYEPLFARLRAKPNGLSVVRAAAVIGREIDRRLLGAVVGLGEDELDDAIDELEDATVLEPWGADGWRFRHELLREVAAELAPPSVRRGLHAEVADALVKGVGGGDPDWRLAAGHYEQALRWEQAASAYRRASNDAQRRGALAEARAYISQAITHIDQIKPGPARDRREIGLRLQRGMLIAAAEGVGSRLAAADMERCLQLGGTDLSDGPTFAAFGNLLIYYATRGDVLRADRIIGLLSPARQLKVFVGASGFLAMLRGELHAARPQIEEWAAGMAATSHQFEDLVLQPYEVKGAPRVALALVHVFQGNLADADSELAAAADHAAQAGFPKGPFTMAYARFAQVWMCTESAQLERAATLAADMLELTARHSFDGWHLVAAAQRAAVDASAALRAGAVDTDAVAAQLVTLGTSLDSWHTEGFGAFAPMYHGVLCRLLIAVGELDEADLRLRAGLQLAGETGVHNCDAELLRLRAHTRSRLDEQKRDIAAAIEMARRQGAHLFRLRAALDDFELRGQPARTELLHSVRQISADSRWPELARARALLERQE
jgi:class 3 adenylate cyclase